MWREHAGLSVTDGSQKQAMMESICSAFMFGARPNGTLRHLCAAVRGRFEARNVCYWRILLKKSKIQRLRKSREGWFFVVPAAASVCKTGTRTYGRFCANRCGPSHRRAWDAPAALKNFVRQPKRTFSGATIFLVPDTVRSAKMQDGPMKCPAAAGTAVLVVQWI